MDPLVNPPNIVVDDIDDITLEPSVAPCMINNTNAPQVVNPSHLSPKVAKSQQKVI
jgi:hypothetical protein